MKKSAGILLFKSVNNQLEIFLVHPGGPFWKNKDLGSWSIPKGEYPDGENPLEAAKREFQEETGTMLSGNFIELNPVKLKSGKLIHAWALQSDIDAATITSNEFEMEWPPKSGKIKRFPEVDRGEWFTFETAVKKVNPAQVGLIEQLQKLLV